MSQHASETCNESNELWLPLTEYCFRSGISTSTIRRKIKSNSIQHRLQNGRYLILFSDENNRAARLLVANVAEEPKVTLGPLPSQMVVTKETKSFQDEAALPLVERTMKMVGNAFEKTIHEKADRIIQLEKSNAELEAQCSELKVLLRMLEEKYNIRY